MGVVYRARQLGLDRDVAIKTIDTALAADARFRARFVREARLTASLEHPHIVPIFDAGQAGGTPFIVMRLIDGEDLGRRLRAGGPLAPSRALPILRAAAAALDAAHARGLVHRDVKPANVLLEGSGPAQRVYLTDFGLARPHPPEAGLTSSGQWMGTLDYAAPEQVAGGALDARTDVYALGCLLYAMLTGRAPFAAVGGLEKATAHARDRPPTLAEAGVRAPGGLQSVLDRALAKDPAGRYDSAGALAAAAASALELDLPPEPTRALGDGEGDGDGDGDGDAVAHTTPPLRRPHRAPAATPTGATEATGATRATRAGLLAVGTLIALAILAAVLLGDTGAGRSGRPAPRRPAPAPTARAAAPRPVVAAAAPGGDTVRCAAGICRQGGAVVLAPIPGGPCRRSGTAGTWLRIDHGAPEPALLCVPARTTATARPGSVPTSVARGWTSPRQALGRLGVSSTTSGGGLFGIIISSRWTVCATEPPAHAALAAGAKVRLFVDRSC